MTGQHGIWVHAVTRGLDGRRLAGLTGVGGGPVHAVEADGLAAVVSAVDLAEFGEEALRRNLEDLAWLESVARAHHHVADAVARFGPVVPARLATVYLDDARVGAVLAERRNGLTAALDRVDGRLEWGVKAYAVAEPAVAGTGDPASGAGEGPGRAYLRRRQARIAATEQSQQAASDGADQLHAAVGGLAVAARRHPPQDRRLSGTPDWMVLNGAYLVDAAGATEFADSVRRLVSGYPTLRVELTGPWPPYSFAAVDDEEPAR